MKFPSRKSLHRSLATLVLVVTSASIGSLMTGVAMATYQPYMYSARTMLMNARKQLVLAPRDKGGHRLSAIAAVDRAIAEVDSGIRYADQNSDPYYQHTYPGPR